MGYGFWSLKKSLVITEKSWLVINFLFPGSEGDARYQQRPKFWFLESGVRWDSSLTKAPCGPTHFGPNPRGFRGSTAWRTCWPPPSRASAPRTQLHDDECRVSKLFFQLPICVCLGFPCWLKKKILSLPDYFFLLDEKANGGLRAWKSRKGVNPHHKVFGTFKFWVCQEGCPFWPASAFSGAKLREVISEASPWLQRRAHIGPVKGKRKPNQSSTPI